MNEIEAKVRCLELAAQVGRAQANFDENSIVEISTKFYNHVKSTMESVSQPGEKAVKSVPKGTPKKDNRPEFLG